MIKIISCGIKFNNSARFIGSSISNLVNNLSERIHKIEYKYGHDTKIKKKWNMWNYIQILSDKNSVTMILVTLIYCCEKLFTCMNAWMIGKKWYAINDRER